MSKRLEIMFRHRTLRTVARFGTMLSVVAMLAFLVGCVDVPPTPGCEEDAECADTDDCTADTCDVDSGVCANDAIAGCCAADDDCADGEVCQDSVCTVVCTEDADCAEDDDACTTAACTDGLCGFTNNADACDDGDACTENDACADGTCAGTAMVCDDGDECTDDSCDAGACVSTDNTADCDDGDACTENDACAAGVCAGTDIVCAENEVCVAGVCEPACEADEDCDDTDECTTDTCDLDDGTCDNTDVVCDDEDLCTDDTCDAVEGCVATAVVCEDGFECDAATGDCVEIEVCADDTDCDDGLFCNGAETCDLTTDPDNPVCVDGTRACDDEDADGNVLTCDEGAVESCEEGDTAAVCTACPGETLDFTLDQDNLTGTTGDDAFVGDLLFNPSSGTQIPSLQTGDSANGLAGADTLDATFNPAAGGTTTAVVTLSGIETFNLTNFGSVAFTVPASSITDLATVCSVNSVDDILLTSLASNVGACLDGLADATKELNLAFLVGATTNPFTGTTDNLAVTIQNTSGGMVDFTTATNGFETVSIDSAGASANTLTDLTVTGGSTTLLSATFTGGAALNAVALPATLTTYDASAMTGGLTLGTGTETGTYAAAGNPASNFVAITGGSGDDVVNFGAILTTTDFSTGTVDLGDGTDVVQNSFAATFGAASKMRNVEEARFNATASGISHNFSGWTGLETISIEEDGTANTFSLTSVPATAGATLPVLNFRGDNTAAAQTYDSLTYGAASASGSSDSLTISVGNRGTNLNTGSLTTNVHTVGGAALTAANIETINIDVADGPATFSGLTASTLVTLDIDAPTSNTSTNVTMGTIAATGTTIQTVDASGVTGNFSATIDFGAATMTISSGAGNDTITIGTSSAATHNSTVTLGNGNNTFTGDTSTAGTDSVTAGTGNDTITAGPGVDTITTGTGQDTINMDNSDTDEAAIDTVSDFTAAVGGDIVKFDVSSLEALDTDGGGADDLIDYGAVTIAGTETFNINLVTADGETMIAGDDMAVIDDDLVTFATMAAYMAAITATVDFVGGAAFAAEDIVLLAYADGAGNTRIGICGDTGAAGTDTDGCDAGEDVLILSGVDVDNLVNGNFSFQP